jgi:hypothetical protein
MRSGFAQRTDGPSRGHLHFVTSTLSSYSGCVQNRVLTANYKRIYTGANSYTVFSYRVFQGKATALEY